MSQEANPYSAPLIMEDRATTGFNELERLRLEHLSHEAALKAVGSLFLIASMGISALMTIFTIEFVQEELINNDETFVLAYWMLVPIFSYVGMRMRRLDPEIRRPVIIAGVLMLLAFPLGTVIGPCVLYMVCCKKGKRILSHRYTNVRFQTPRFQYRTKLSTKILTVIIGVSVIAFVLYYISPQARQFLQQYG